MARTYDYKLRIGDGIKKVEVSNLSQLTIRYKGSSNELDDCLYDPKCTSPPLSPEGFVSITLEVNGELVILRSDDEKNGTNSLVDIGGHYYYLFQGKDYEVLNRSREETYLVFHIRRIEKGFS